MAPQRSARPEDGDAAPPEARDGDPGLFAAGGPFEQFPGAVLLVGRGGRVLGATHAASPLTDYLETSAGPEVSEALSAALNGKAAQINPFLLETPESGGDFGQAYDLVVLPWITGDTALFIARDITLERSLRAALIESRQRYKDLVEASSDFAWETDSEGRFTFVSPRGAAGYAAGQLVGQPANETLLESGEAEVSPFTTRSPVDRVEVWVHSAEGRSACLSAVAVPLVGPAGEWRGARGVCREVTHERAKESELARARHREALLGYILRIVRDELEPASMLKAAAGALVPALSARGVAMYRRRADGAPELVAEAGRLPEAELYEPLLERLDVGETGAGEDEVGEALDDGHLLIKATRYQNRTNGALCLWRDGEEALNDEENRMLLAEITAQIGVANEQLAREQELEKLSSTDDMTGLLNRRSFLAQVEQRSARSGGEERPGALLYIDLDNFKAVNDLRGHEAGDRVLIDLASLLKGQIRKGDLAGRLGGDEFALFLVGIDEKAVRRKAKALLAAAFELRKHSASKAQPLGFSIGIAMVDPACGESAEALIARADRAMYMSKRSGKGRVSLAEPAGGVGRT